MSEWAAIKVGDVHAFESTLSLDDVRAFAKLSGDDNPIHVEPDYAKKFGFGSNLAHGMLAACLFSRLVGKHPAWKHPLYLDQSLSFRAPIYPGDKLTVRGTIAAKSDATQVVTLKTEILKDGRIAVDGAAHVKVLSLVEK